MPHSFLDYLLAHENFWMIQVFLIVLATTALGLAGRWVLRRLKQQIQRTHTLWDDAALEAAERPLLALIWVLGLNVACLAIASHTGSGFFRYASDVRALLLIVILAWFLTRFVRAAEEQLLQPEAGQHKVDVTSARAISKLLRISIVITATLILLERLGYSVAGVMAFGGIGGIAIGFAAKDMLANFFGGLMIFLDRPFSIGDWVRSPDRNIEGTVEHIGWRQTRIRTFDRRPLYVPNSAFASIAVENPSRMTHRRIKETIGLRYDDWKKLPAILDKLNAMLAEHDGIVHDPAPDASLDKLNASSLDIVITAFTKARDSAGFARAKQDVLLRSMKIIDGEQAEIAFPTQTLHVAKGSELLAETMA